MAVFPFSIVLSAQAVDEAYKPRLVLVSNRNQRLGLVIPADMSQNISAIPPYDLKYIWLFAEICCLHVVLPQGYAQRLRRVVDFRGDMSI